MKKAVSRRAKSDIAAKALSIGGVTWEFGLPGTAFNYVREVGDGLKSGVIVAALNWKMRAFPEAPIVIERRKGEVWEIQRGHALEDILENPNPFYDGRVLLMATVMDYQFGEAFWLKVRNDLGKVVELWWIPRALIKPIYDEIRWPGVYIHHYEYRHGVGATVELAVEDVVHFKFGMDPTNTRRGFSQLNAMFREVYIDDQAANFTASILRNLGIIGLIFSPKTGSTGIPPGKLNEFKQYVQENFTGDKRGNAMAFSHPIDATVLSYNLQGFNVGPIRDIAEERICAAIGIPAAVIGFGTGLQQTKVGAPQPLSARLWTPTGPTTMGEIQPGDLIAVPGGWTPVKHVYPQGVQDIYQVTFQDGSTAESTFDHLWDVETPNIGRQVLPLSEIATMPWWKRRRASVPLQGVTEFAEQPTLIPPYVMGLLLADGSFRRNLFFSNADPEIVEFMREEVGTEYAINHSQGMDYRIAYRNHAQGRGIGGGSGNRNPFVEELRRLGLWMLYSPEKFVPDIYKYNSSRTRLELLRGLLDGDGFVNLHGQPALEQTSSRLAADVTFLVQSLGGYTLQHLKPADRRTRWILGRPMHSNYDRYYQSIVIDDGARLFRCEYKASRCRPRGKVATRKFRKIELVRQEEAQCIEVEGGLYLTDNFIVTHNTMREMIQLAWRGALMPEQKIIAGEMRRSLMGEFQDNPSLFRVRFDASKIHALWEDDLQKGQRVSLAVENSIITVGEARRELGYPVDSTQPDYYLRKVTMQAVPTTDPMAQVARVTETAATTPTDVVTDPGKVTPPPEGEAADGET